MNADVERFLTRRDWEAARVGPSSGIGASEAASIMGQCPYSNATDVWLKKTGRSAPSRPTIPMRIGTALEPEILRLYGEETGFDVVPFDQESRLRSRDHSWMTCTPDGVVHAGPSGEPRLVQAKSVEIRSREQADQWGQPGTDEIPFQYLIQTHHEMVVTGFDVVDVPVLFGKSEFKVFTVRKDRGLADGVVDATGTFWNECVLADVPPDDEYASPAQLLKIYPGCEGSVEFGDDVAEAILALDLIRDRAKSGDKEKQRLTSIVLAAFGEARVGRLPDGGMVKRIVTRVPERTQTVKAYETQRFVVVKGS